MTRCLVLGATGFIGGQIARAADAAGWQVRGLRRRPGATGTIGDLDVEWVGGDLADRPALLEASRGCDVVFHTAAAYPHAAGKLAEDVRAAVEQMRNVLIAAGQARVARLVYTSSFTTIGPARHPGGLADEQDFYVPGASGDPYYEAKWAMEVEALAAAQAGLPVVVLCPTAVFGPGDVHLSVSGPLLMVARGRMPVYVDATLSTIDVRDVAAAHVAAATHGRVGERYILNSHNLPLREAFAEMARVACAPPPRIHIGPRLLNAIIAVGQLVPGSPVGYLRTMRLWRPVSNAKAVAELGLQSRPFADTVSDALAWFRENEHG